MNTAMPSAMGAAISSARIDEYSVPQMNGSAPNSPDTGSQISVRQKFTTELGYAPLPASVVQMELAAIEKVKVS